MQKTVERLIDYTTGAPWSMRIVIIPAQRIHYNSKSATSGKERFYRTKRKKCGLDEFLINFVVQSDYIIGCFMGSQTILQIV
jgi:hypothetical protein